MTIPSHVRIAASLEQDDVSSNRHLALPYCWSMIPRVELEGMLFRKPVSTPDQVRVRLFRDHALFDQAAFHHRVDALVAVDELRYAQVAGKAAEHISLLGAPSLELDEPADHVAQRLLGGVVEIRIEAEREVVGGRARPRHGEA